MPTFQLGEALQRKLQGKLVVGGREYETDDGYVILAIGKGGKIEFAAVGAGANLPDSPIAEKTLEDHPNVERVAIIPAATIHIR